MKPSFRLVAMITLLLGAQRLQAAQAVSHGLTSPGGRIEVVLSAGENPTYSVRRRGSELISPSAISMTIDGARVLGALPRIQDVRRRSVRETLTPVVRQKAAALADVFNEMVLIFAGDYSLTFRAYDDGVAYRFSTSFPDRITVASERAEFAFPADHTVYFAEETSFQTHQERLYLPVRLSRVTSGKFGLCPAVVDVPGGPKVAITEADLEDYPGMYLTGAEGAPTTLVGKFPQYALKEEAKNDRNVPVVERADFLAVTSGTRAFPWRVLVIAERDGTLIESPMIYRLAKPSSGDFSWVKPGKVAWDWWNDWNIAGVDFRAGVNTETYKHYIDFAAENGIEYVILDEGWYKLGDLLTLSPGIDMDAILAHARSRNVGIILWVVWKTLEQQWDKAFEQFSRWGVAGLKVDFMQRDDQRMVDYYYRVAQEAARRRFLVDFHGAFKPTGLYRTFPNVITSEGVLGLEHNKWSRNVTPEHDVTLPFTRMLAGPMDYTPGAMANGALKNFQPIYSQPMSQGTRAHQLALYIVYESPLQMLADSPTNYRREPECLEFLAGVPTVWDETRVLDARLADYVLVARRKGADWYLGALTDEAGRDLVVDLSFLGEAEYDLTAYQDGLNADRNGNDYKKLTRRVRRTDSIAVHMAPVGGWAAVLTARSR